MNSKKLPLILISCLIVSSTILFLSSPMPAHANILNDIINGVKNIFSPNQQQSQQLSISSKIILAPNGDINKNGKIDAGDTVSFIYTISNTTSNTYSFALLKTNINTNILNSINNVQGTTNINDANHTITVPNLHINPNQQIIINFNATTNFNKDSDQTLSTEPELLDQNNTSLAKGQKQEVTVTKMSTDAFNTFVHITN